MYITPPQAGSDNPNCINFLSRVKNNSRDDASYLISHTSRSSRSFISWPKSNREKHTEICSTIRDTLLADVFANPILSIDELMTF
jgi:hypothetical protein